MIVSLVRKGEQLKIFMKLQVVRSRMVCNLSTKHSFTAITTSGQQDMDTPDDEHDRAYRKKFRGVRSIIEKHFSDYEPDKLTGMVHFFIAHKEAALFEAWNYNEQQRCLSGLRAQLQKASVHLDGIHPGILEEISINLTLPIEILNGTKDRKTCSKEVFESAPGRDEITAATNVFRGLMAFSENIDKAITYTQSELPLGIPSGNRKIDAWRVVDGAAELIRAHACSINVPSRMNGSGDMWRFLVDLFEHYKITANVDAAFIGWIKHIDRKHESFGSLPID